MKIGIIGAGKVGVTLGKYLKENAVTVTGYYSRTFTSSVEAAEFTNTKAYQSLQALVEASDTLFITTPDGQIGSVWDYIANYDIENKVICHFSGSLSSKEFSGIDATGAAGCSIHPMYAFSDKFESYKQFHTALLTIEGQEKAVNAIRPLFERLGHTVFVMQSDDKVKYHAAAALASNYMVGLLSTSVSLLEECGFSEQAAMQLLSPLVSANVETILREGPVKALTGPIERNDIETVQKHLTVLAGTETKDSYCSLGKELVRIAEKKNADRDYTAMRTLLEKFDHLS